MKLQNLLLRKLQDQEVEQEGAEIEAELQSEIAEEVILKILFFIYCQETHFLSQSILAILALIALNALALTYLRKAKLRYPKIARYIQDATITTLIGT